MAVTALERGFDGPHLRALAGYDRNSPESEYIRDLRGAVAELGITVPTEPDARVGYLRWLSRQLLDGMLELDTFLTTAHREVVTPLGHASHVGHWCFIDEGLHPEDFHELTPEERESVARDYALRLVDGEGADAESDAPN
jgi:hypothetical protein